MDSSAPHWHELGEILQGPPGWLAFRAAAALLDIWPGDDLDDAIAFAQHRLSDWPDETRTAPWAWGWALTMGHAKPTWRLVRGVETRAGHLGVKEIPFEAITSRSEMRRLPRLKLPRWPWETEKAIPVFRQMADELTSLACVQIWKEDRDDFGDLESLPVWGRLRELHVGAIESDIWHGGPPSFVPKLNGSAPWQAVTMRARDLIAVWEQASLPKLRSASLWITDLEEAERLAQRPELAQLQTLALAFRCSRALAAIRIIGTSASSPLTTPAPRHGRNLPTLPPSRSCT